VRAVAVAFVGALAASVLLLFAGGSSSAPAPASPPAAPACVPLSAGTHRLPAIDGRIPVVLHVGRGAKAGAPLVLGLPGAGQTARDFATYTGYSEMADRKGFSVA